MSSNYDSTSDDMISMDPAIWTELQYGHPIDHIEQSGNNTAQPESTPAPEAPPLRGSNDAFAKREGKNLSFSGITVTVATPSDRKMGMEKQRSGQKTILDNVWGVAHAGVTTAIMGPSGAGKTMLLNVLSGRLSTNAKFTVQSHVHLDNTLVDPTNIYIRRKIAFVSQDDSLPTSSTPRECILFSAKLRMPRDTTNAQHETLTESMLHELGLEECANVLIGGGRSMVQGISGGERKRTSVGVELVTKPEMVFLDEPTSGLDSFSALQLCQVLKRVASAGASVVFTIHQPSSDIFDSFDRLMVMNQGRIMYQGPVQGVDDYFAVRNHVLPPKYNPADWIMIVAQSFPVEELEAEGFFEKDPSPHAKERPSDRSSMKQLKLGAIAAEKHNHVGFGTQIKLLFLRDFKSIGRDKRVLGGRLMLTGFISLLMGVIFWQVGNSNSANVGDLQSHFGAEVMILMSAMMGTALPALMVFPSERPVFIREYSTNHYRIAPYFAAKLAIEAFLTSIQMLVLCLLSYFMIGFQLPFGWHFLIIYVLAMASNALAVLIGSLVPNPDMAVEFLPVCFIPQLLFAGFFVRPELIPVWLRWLMYVFPLTYAVRLHMNLEFGDCAEGAAAQNCEGLLANTLVDPDDVWWYWIALVSLFVVLRLSALAALRKRASKFY